MPQKPLTSPLRIGDVEVANRILLAPLAGIGSWFVRLQARRHGAGLAVSEMVSSFAVHHRNERTLREMLRLHPGEHPVSVQLFGSDPDVMRSAAATVAERGADLIDINMGCPVRKVCRTGAGAALLGDHDRAVALARAAIDGSGRPVTVKLRCGHEPGDRAGLELAVKLAEEAGVAAIAVHPRPAATRHRGKADYRLVRELRRRVGVPVIVSGGLRGADRIRRAYAESGADAVMIARGALGNPWVFGELAGTRSRPPAPEEVVDELLWVVGCAEQHFGGERAARNLRKFYPWYLERLGVTGPDADAFQRTTGLDEVRHMLAGVVGAARPHPSPAPVAQPSPAPVASGAQRLESAEPAPL